MLLHQDTVFKTHPANEEVYLLITEEIRDQWAESEQIHELNKQHRQPTYHELLGHSLRGNIWFWYHLEPIFQNDLERAMLLTHSKYKKPRPDLFSIFSAQALSHRRFLGPAR